MKRVYLLCCFLLGSLLTNAQNCPPNNLTLELNIPQPAYCTNDEVTFSTNVSATNYFWHLGQSITYATTTPQFTTNYQTGGIYEILLVVGYGNNCQDSITATLEIVDAEVEFDYTIDEDRVFFEADTSAYILNYFWDFGNQLTGSGSSVITSYPIPGSYPVTLFTSGICPPDSTTQTITIAPPTPTEDTPTACGDGIDNDGDGQIDCADSDCACDEDNDGTIASEDPDDNNPCVPDNTVPQCQSTSNPQLFEDYPFLETLIDPNNCTEGKVSLYQQGSFFFLFVETSTSSKLYFQTGQFYCESTSTYDCVGAYNLGEAIDTWNCSSSRPVDNDGDGVFSDMDPDDNDPCNPNDSATNCLKDLDGDGVFSDMDPDDNNPCVPNDSAANCLKDLDEDGVFSDMDPDDNDPCVPNNTATNCTVDTTVIATPAFFDDFPWLSDIVNTADCNGEKISIYQSGTFSFIYIETQESSILYFENGTFYCQSAPNFDCVAAYNLSNPYEVWTCTGTPIIDADNDGTPAATDPDDNNPCIPNDSIANCIKDIDGDGVFSDVDPDDNDPCVPNNTSTNCTVDTTILVTPAFFDDFPWLSNIVNTSNCNGEKISIYQSGAFSFLYVETQESGILYFESGTFYCQSAPNFDCVAAYNLSNPYEVWTCTGTPIIDFDNDGTPAEMDPDDNDPCIPDDNAANCLKDLDGDDVLSDVDPDDNDPCIPDDSNANCVKDMDNDGVFSDVDPDDNDPCVPNNSATNCTTDTLIVVTPAFFDDFPWLNDLVNPANCNNERISIYDLGSYAFIFVETENSSTLYFETGAFYCANSPNYDCLAAYNLTNPTEIWECNGQVVPPIETPDCNNNKGSIIFVDCDNGEEFYMIETDAGLILDIYFDEGINFNYYEGQSVKFDFKNADFDSPCTIAAKAVTITCIEEIRDTPTEVTPALFEKYTFLYNLIDPSDCLGESVTVYTSGVFDYLLVETATETTLYFQDGTFFCSQTPTYNCVTAYGFNASNITDSWDCGQATFSTQATTRSNTSTLSLEEGNVKKWIVNAYPNPAQNHLWVAINSQQDQTVELSLLDKTGRLILKQSTAAMEGENKLPLTLSSINSGMYYLVVQSQDTGERAVRKIMVVKQ